MQTTQRKRNIELFLLLFAMILGFFAMGLTQINVLSTLKPEPFIYLGGLYLLAWVMHGLLRKVAKKADPLLLPVGIMLNSLGVVEIYRLDLADKVSGWQAASTRQIVWSAIALVVAGTVLALLKNHRRLQRYTYLWGLGALALLLLPQVPGLGRSVDGARVWIQVAGLSLQPGELAKIALAIFFAGYLYTHRETLSLSGRRFGKLRLPIWRNLAPLLVLWALAMLIIVLQRDLGTGLLYFGLFLVMVYLATGKTLWVLTGVVLLASGALLAARLLSYVGYRFDNWLNPFDPHNYDRTFGGSYQLVQGLFGLAFGGLLGTGLGRGYPEITPLAQSDYIMASLGEELGLTGVVLILIMYLLLFARALRIGFIATDDFSKLLASGLALVMALQVFIVVGGIFRIIPLTGLTAPFLAAGGSSLLANWIILAIILRLSDSLRPPKPMLITPKKPVEGEFGHA